jgi:hypothetical protein
MSHTGSLAAAADVTLRVLSWVLDPEDLLEGVALQQAPPARPHRGYPAVFAVDWSYGPRKAPRAHPAKVPQRALGPQRFWCQSAGNRAPCAPHAGVLWQDAPRRPGHFYTDVNDRCSTVRDERIPLW